MRGLWKLTWIELKLFLRDVMAAFFILIFPLLMLVLMGSIYGNGPSPDFGGFGFVDVSVPTYTGMIIAIGGLWILSIEMSVDRERGVLRRLKATPLRPQTILTARVLRIFVMMVLGMILMIIFGIIVFDLRFNGNPLSIVIAFIISSMSFFAIGFFLASILPNARTAQSVAMALFFVMLFLSGAVIPFEVFSERMLSYARILPLTQVNLLLRGLWLGDSWGDFIPEVVALLATIIVCVGVSLKTFRWE